MSHMIAGSLQLAFKPTSRWLQDLREGCEVTVNGYVGHVYMITRWRTGVYVDITIDSQPRRYAPDDPQNLEALPQPGEGLITVLVKALGASEDGSREGVTVGVTGTHPLPT